MIRISRSRFVYQFAALVACLGLVGLTSDADAQQPPSPRHIGVILVGKSPESEEVQQFRVGATRRRLHRGARCGDRVASRSTAITTRYLSWPRTWCSGKSM